MDKSFYAILEVGRHASGETINAAYETLVKNMNQPPRRAFRTMKRKTG